LKPGGGWALLAPLALGYGAAVSLRNTLYDKGLLPVQAPGPAVLSVGNLAAGGSGKTPLTLAFAHWLAKRAPELPLAIVSRGYGRRSHGVLVVADELGMILSPEEGGDEPALLAKELPGVPVIVAERRVEGIRTAAERFGARIVLLDDAFQHRAVGRDLDVVLLDETAPAWSWRLLPAGRLREPAGGLRRAQLVILSGGGPAALRRRVREWIGGYAPEAVVAEGSLGPRRLRVHGGEELYLPLERLRGLPVAAVCGIARPERFFHTLEALGASLIRRRALRDHAYPSTAERMKWKNDARRAGAKALVVTEKDAVKWPMEEGEPPVWVLETEWRWGAGREGVDDLLERFVETARRRGTLHNDK